MKKHSIFFLVCLSLLSSCKEQEGSAAVRKAPAESTYVEVHGHRGDRGNFPENSIPAFISALDKGVDVLELDVVISRDSLVVVSHEPFMSHLFMLKPAGDSIPESDELSLNLFEMNYDSIKTYDAGSKKNPLFPRQRNLKTYKPLLSEVIDTVESHLVNRNLPALKYNIEIKSAEKYYGTHQPSPEEYTRLVMQVIEEKDISERVYIQSFDPRVLNFMNAEYPQVQLSYLVSKGDLTANLEKLDFVPEIYSPPAGLISDRTAVEKIQEQRMKLIPWSTDEPGEIERLLNLGVDGIISDFPEEAIRLRNKHLSNNSK